MIFNLDDTGFMLGIGTRQHVALPKGQPHFKGVLVNRQSTTVIKCTGSGGQMSPPVAINAGKIHKMVNPEAWWTLMTT